VTAAETQEERIDAGECLRRAAYSQHSPRADGSRESGSGTETDVYSCRVSQQDEWAEDCGKLLSQCGRMRDGISAEKQKNDYKVLALADSLGSIVAVDGASFEA